MSARVAAPLWLLLAALMLAVAACGGPSNLVHAEVNPEKPVVLST